jgi:outer membrane protein assembly factor BamB
MVSSDSPYAGGQVFVQNSDSKLTTCDATTGHANWATAPGQHVCSALPIGSGVKGALIVSSAAAVSSETFGDSGVRAFDATNMYVVNCGVQDGQEHHYRANHGSSGCNDERSGASIGSQPITSMDREAHSPAAMMRNSVVGQKDQAQFRGELCPRRRGALAWAAVSAGRLG